MMKNLFILVAILFFVSLAGGANAQTNQKVSVSKEIKVNLGKTVAVKGEGLKLQFVSVTNDSRCPEGETCIWEGDAEILIKVSKAKKAASSIKLHSNATSDQSRDYGQYTIKLIALEPKPKKGVVNKARSYIATLLVTKK